MRAVVNYRSSDAVCRKSFDVKYGMLIIGYMERRIGRQGDKKMGVIGNNVYFGKGEMTWSRLFWSLIAECAMAQMHGNRDGVVNFKVNG